MARPVDIERRNKIINVVLTNGRAKINDLAQMFDVTTETIRKDVTELSEKNILQKGHGIVLPASNYIENSLPYKISQNADAKSKIANYAASLITKKSVIFIDSGTTVLQLANILNMFDDLTIITNSMMAANTLSNSKNQLLVTGGELRPKSYSYVGAWTLRALRQSKIDVAFLGCDGFHPDGPTVGSYRELEAKEVVLGQAEKSILLADTSKITQQGLYCYCTFSELDLLIFERNLNDTERPYIPDSVKIHSL
ncbi:DeoR/GlpR transcriptional regulator [Salmonella enterica subsp. enterica]|uniref:DeoR/GlpR transcriptional regulator n=1 Tax=Salmonella enterica I TaxID=59201 RepID=A0A7Z1TGT9_SALET|nr:DeoR/GlpR family DNA-binding transcription regulator [Salmonella enterica]PUF26127.1 DeoR/GlpR transcriptional regulator [Salmonella enterica subsp. enterica]PUF50565.1 DeoR/GlpR transcriptional regulator [Salmonella enterica subsp. enterica]